MPYSKIKQLDKNYTDGLIKPLIKMLSEAIQPRDQALILALDQSQPDTKAKAFLAIFVSLRKHPTLIEHPEWTKLQGEFYHLFRACMTNPNDQAELYNILNKPQNKVVKDWFDDYLQFMTNRYEAVNNEKSAKKRPTTRR